MNDPGSWRPGEPGSLGVGLAWVERRERRFQYVGGGPTRARIRNPGGVLGMDRLLLAVESWRSGR